MAPGTDPGAVDLIGAGMLPAAWRARWAANPSSEVVRDPDGSWASGSELLERTAEVAGRFAAAGLGPGDRVLIAALLPPVKPD